MKVNITIKKEKEHNVYSERGLEQIKKMPTKDRHFQTCLRKARHVSENDGIDAEEEGFMRSYLSPQS